MFRVHRPPCGVFCAKVCMKFAQRRINVRLSYLNVVKQTRHLCNQAQHKRGVSIYHLIHELHGMSQDSHHGKWTISSSDDDDDEALPPSGTHRPAASSHSPHLSAPPSVPKLEPVSASVEVKPEPANPPVSSLVIGSEARQSAAKSQVNPVKYETGPSLAGKRKKEVSDGSGWALSDSDDDDGDVKGKSASNLPKRAPPSPKAKKPKVESERPPSPHGRLYYIDEPDDFFESSIPCLNDTYRFYLNKVTGLDRKYNSGALHIKDILSPLFGTLKESVQFNYCFDISWMVNQFPPEFRDRPVLIVHGDKREAKARLLQQAQPFPHVRFCQAKLDIAFGTHHTKMMLLWYEEGFRVVILTSNLIRADWYQKTQGMWMSPLFPRLPEGSGASAGESPTFFKRDLLEYLASYRAPELEDWIQRIKEHDLSETRVYLVGSTPGRYVGSDMERWGHLRLRKLLYENTEPIPGDERWPVIGQFSSIGSMGLDKTKWLAGEFQRTLTTLGKSSLRSDTPVHLNYTVWCYIEFRTRKKGQQLPLEQRMFQQCEEPRFTIEQIDLLQRLRRTGITQAEVLHALDTLEHLDRQHGHKLTHKPSYMPPSSSLSSSSTAAATSSMTSAATQTSFPDNQLSMSPNNNFDAASLPLPVPVSSPSVVMTAVAQNGLVAVSNGRLSPPRFPLGVVSGNVTAPGYGFEASEEDIDVDEKVEDLMRRDSALIKEEIKSFLGNRRISQAVVAQVTGISQSRISHWLLQQGSDLSEQKKRAFFRWYQLEKTNPGATLAMRAAPLALEDMMEWQQAPPPFGTAPGGFRLRRGSRFTWRKECLAVMESYFSDNQYPDEAKREEIATACNGVIHKPEAAILESHGIEVQSPGGQSNSDEVDGNDFPDQACEVSLFDKKASARQYGFSRADLSSPTQVPTLLPSWFSALGRGQRGTSLIGRSLVTGAGPQAEGSRLTGVSWSPPSPSLQDEPTVHSVLSEAQDAIGLAKAAANQVDGAGCGIGNDIKTETLEED
ncbi:hypothetical protein F2P81_004882 [Scophthalmus maximus]|uniref:Uncharacterized protein n=1 Tax=Scophthalmus maximus TaxID=52904 RepID=A0A6A4TEC4_SCOMX|nr:hypothetical protein F2P81_004882 [Scophthalmus maximus]